MHTHNIYVVIIRTFNASRWLPTGTAQLLYKWRWIKYNLIMNSYTLPINVFWAFGKLEAS